MRRLIGYAITSVCRMALLCVLGIRRPTSIQREQDSFTSRLDRVPERQRKGLSIPSPTFPIGEL
jgi:hypothetical protein